MADPAESHQPWPNYPPGNNFSEVNPQANRPPWPTYQSNGERPPVIHKPEGLRHPSQLSVERNTYEFSAAIDAPQKNYESEYMTVCIHL